MDLEGYQPTMDVEGNVLTTVWKTETRGASRLRIGFSPRGRMYDVTLLVERRSGSEGAGTPVGREDPLMQKWEKILRSLLALEPNED
jgi:hypothetical protein